ncbi:protein CANDIDATE G-PROTEIN COUPLED RECEPTOR 7-like [Rhododendron vialii]|uniref:protein CANDIDATE G-PROTEIN COUPLED RECEPTOR 7-like n=1 Tax=Rhododendron vialii TaxID=182163 RepID=UPI00265FC654|nr:protein CANDIDATE G-PROTEIN COUPLED RECEPTOR 7-like [Rhododendron vialii]
MEPLCHSKRLFVVAVVCVLGAILQAFRFLFLVVGTEQLAHITDKMHQINSLLVLFFFLLFRIPSTTGDIKTATISSDSRRTILFEDFCFDLTGHLSLNVSNVSFTTTSTIPINTSRIGFFFGDLYALEYYGMVILDQEGKTCILESPNLIPGLFQPIATFAELSPPPQSSVSKTLPIPPFTVNNETRPVHSPDHLGIYFSNCEPNTSVSMHVHVETYNIDRNGKDYLEVGRTQLPMIYFIFSFLYMPFLALWVYICYKNRSFVRKIHILMVILVVMKSLNLLFEAEDKHYIKVSGTPHGWDIWFYLFHFLRALLLVTVIMLIGTGWTILKPTLHAKDKETLAVGVTIQVFASIVHVYTDEIGPSNSNYLYLTLALCVVDLMGFTIVFAPIYSTMKTLKDAAKTDGTAARDLGKMRLLSYFNGCVLAFWQVKWFAWIYVNRFSSDTDEDCGLEWLIVTIEEIVALGFYIGMFYLFWPREQNEYIVVQDEETALATIHSEFADI